VISFSFTIVIMVVVAAYTANTAAFLTLSSSTVDSFTTIDDLMGYGLPVCALKTDGAVYTLASQRYPRLSLVGDSQLVEGRGTFGADESVMNVRAGVCSAGLKFALGLDTMMKEVRVVS
jgi:hypothetical protein